MDGDDGHDGDPAGTKPRLAPGARAHPPKKKVDLTGGAGKAPAEGSTAKPKSRPATKRPIYRRGGFWVGVIMLEVVGALIISFAASKPADVDDLTGGDLAAFCADVQHVRGQVTAPSLDLAATAKEFQAQADTFRRIEAVAPTNLRADLATLAALSDELVTKTNEILQRKAADPSYTGAVTDLDAAQGQVVGRATEASNHLDAVVLRGCGIDLGAAPTTVPASSTAPTTATR